MCSSLEGVSAPEALLSMLMGLFFSFSCCCSVFPTACCSATLLRPANRVHNGQALDLEQQSCEEGPPRDLLMGLFGTTAFYDHVTSTQMLHLDKCVRLTRVLRGMRVSQPNQYAMLFRTFPGCVAPAPMILPPPQTAFWLPSQPQTAPPCFSKPHLHFTTFSLHVTLTHLMPQPMGAGQTMLSSSEVIFAHSFRVSESSCCCCTRAFWVTGVTSLPLLLCAAQHSTTLPMLPQCAVTKLH